MFYPLEGGGIPEKYVCCKCMVFGAVEISDGRKYICVHRLATQIVMQMKPEK